MIDDVKSQSGRLPIGFFGRTGGMLPETEEIVAAVLDMLKEPP